MPDEIAKLGNYLKQACKLNNNNYTIIYLINTNYATILNSDNEINIDNNPTYSTNADECRCSTGVGV